MKLLLIVNSKSTLDYLKELIIDYPSLKTHFIYICKDLDINQLINEIKEFNPYLILTIGQAEYTEQYIDKSKLINIVNSYGSINQIESLTLSQENKVTYSENVINRNTVFFNVFLEFPKGVSVDDVSQFKDLKRIDTVSNSNFILASIFHQLLKQYYILNYCNELKKEDVKYIFEHLN